MLRKCVSQDILLAFRFQCWMHTWVMVTWSRRNCRSFRRTSKLALAFCRFFCRRSVAYTKDCQINNFFNKCKINNYSSCFIKGKKKKKSLCKQKPKLYLFTWILQHYICSQPQAYWVSVLDTSTGIYAFWYFKISNQGLQWKSECKGCQLKVNSPDSINTIQTI